MLDIGNPTLLGIHGTGNGMSNEGSFKGYEFGKLSYTVIGACIDVQRQLGVHCMEVDYQRALELALKKQGLWYRREVEIGIVYDGQVVTRRRVDFVIGDEQGYELLLETKARSQILPEDVEQCLLYLQNSGQSLCLLANFGQKPIGIQRLVNTPKDAPGDPRAAGR
jgi:GxxExxY protein